MIVKRRICKTPPVHFRRPFAPAPVAFRRIPADTRRVISRLFLSVLFLAVLLLFSLLPLHALELYRPENRGDMNDVPCLIKITDMEGNDAWDSITALSYSWHYDIHTNLWQEKCLCHAYWKGCFTGGCVVHLGLKSGKYRISVYTPKESQLDYERLTGEDWQSNEFVYDTERKELKVIFISPTADDSGVYDGGWHVDHIAPAYYRGTKPGIYARSVF